MLLVIAMAGCKKWEVTPAPVADKLFHYSTAPEGSSLFLSVRLMMYFKSELFVATDNGV